MTIQDLEIRVQNILESNSVSYVSVKVEAEIEEGEVICLVHLNSSDVKLFEMPCADLILDDVELYCKKRRFYKCSASNGINR
jgi:hypothetical protein